MSDLNAIFYISLSTLFCGGIGLLIKTIYKIKCSEVVCCCGCLKFNREINDELQIDIERNHREFQARRSSSLNLGINNI